MPSSTRKTAATAKSPSATGTRRSTSAQRTQSQAMARNDPIRSLLATFKETGERSMGGLEQEWEKRRQVRLPIVDATVTLPPPDRATFYVGLGALAALEVVEWPVAVVVGVGHYLATRSRSTAGKELGEAAESA